MTNKRYVPDCDCWQKWEVTICHDTLSRFIPVGDNLPISAEWQYWWPHCPICGKPAKEEQ